MPRPRVAVVPVALIPLLALLVVILLVLRPHGPTRHEVGEIEHVPSDWFYAQRANPDGTVPQDRYDAALEQLRVERAGTLHTSAGLPLWQPVGPYNIGGRVTALAVAPGALYLGAADGGVWKSVNAGVNWTCVTNTQSFVSIGALAVDPSNPNVVYCGTGEANGSVDSYDGNGLWRSSDGGATWVNIGLTATGRISSVVVDPANPQHLLVGAMGRQFSTGPDRGMYRTLDGGKSWSNVLFVSDSAGVTSIAINPVHPDTMYCASWERVRRLTYRRAGGAGSGIWRSIDRGATWNRLTNGLPVADDNLGRIALAVAPSRPSTVYAQIGTGTPSAYIGYGLFRSLDAGDSWSRRDGAGFVDIFGGAASGFCWYFGAMGVDPVNPERIYAMGVSLARSDNGGVTWIDVTGALHPDQHAIWIDPAAPAHILVGNDGGFYWTTTGASWTPTADLPITQFYAGDVDPTNPARVFGGTQDNNTLMTSTGPASWFAILGGDGFWPLVDPVNPNVVFSEYQFCSYGAGFLRSTTGGPSPSFTVGWVSTDRWGWSTPIAINPRNHNTLIAGSQYVYRSTNNGTIWARTSSADLTTNPGAVLVYGTITTLDISKADTSLYYVGTDDGKVWRSNNVGATWTDLTAGLPRRWVTRVVPDPLDAQVVYVTLSGYTQDASAALVYRSANQGASWTSISGNLPNVPANDLVVDPVNTQQLFLGTDIGVWYTTNQGATWAELGAGLPLQVVADLTLNAASRQLFAFTHGRSAWKLDLGALPAAVTAGAPAPDLALSAPWPNPARNGVRMHLELSRDSNAEVVVYDVIGRRVSTLHEGRLGAGRHAIAWDARDANGRPARAGVYFVRAVAEGSTRTQRVVLAD
jgi:hypothetical protein